MLLFLIWIAITEDLLVARLIRTILVAVRGAALGRKSIIVPEEVLVAMRSEIIGAIILRFKNLGELLLIKVYLWIYFYISIF